jgi:hypothetical protein
VNGGLRVMTKCGYHLTLQITSEETWGFFILLDIYSHAKYYKI